MALFNRVIGQAYQIKIYTGYNVYFNGNFGSQYSVDSTAVYFNKHNFSIKKYFLLLTDINLANLSAQIYIVK
jgi:hypothetical protein